MSGRARAVDLAWFGTAAQVAGSQVALAASNFAVLAVAARTLDSAGFAALSSYYLLVNTVGRGTFAAVELESTRTTALALATGAGIHRAQRAALRNALVLLAAALVLVVAAAPLLSAVLGSSLAAVALLAVGAVTMAVSYVVRGPLAGAQEYRGYGATFWFEAAGGLAAALVLAATGVRDTTAWIAVFALAPLLATVGMRRGTARPTDPERATAPRGARSDVLYAAALLLAGQGVWNLAPVLVNARLADAPATAAGFVTVAVLLRVPVLLFPAAQALLLPTVTAGASTGDGAALRQATRKLTLIVAVGGVIWLVAGVSVVPVLARTIFATTATPPTWVLAVLAVSTVVGAATQIPQTHLVARGRQRAVALCWLAGLVALLVVGLTVAPPISGAALGQLVAALLALALLTTAHRRGISRNGAPL